MLSGRALGESQKADDARGWFIVSLAMLAVYLAIGARLKPLYPGCNSVRVHYVLFRPKRLVR